MSCSQEAALAVAGLTPHRHAAILQPRPCVPALSTHNDYWHTAWRRACAASARQRPAAPPGSADRPTRNRMGTDSCDLPRCSLSRPCTIRPRMDGLCELQPGGGAGRRGADAAQARRHTAAMTISRTCANNTQCLLAYSMAACLHGIGTATTCGAPRLSTQAHEPPRADRWL